MPRRKNTLQNSNCDGMPQESKDMLVQKANPLQSLSKTKMSLPEFKILDAYLSRIDSHKPDERYVYFGKGELERLLGVIRSIKQTLSRGSTIFFRQLPFVTKTSLKSILK